MSITPLYLSNNTHNYTDYAGLPIKGQGNYCAVLIDLETSKLITIIPGERK
jgi:hypothetical protein